LKSRNWPEDQVPLEIASSAFNLANMAVAQPTRRLTEAEYSTSPGLNNSSGKPITSGCLREAVGINATLELPALGIQIELARVFANVDFPPNRPQNPPRRHL
jgi:hypothetical protein